jgi:L-lactate dehydrogenase complex protein LldG
MIGLRWIRLPTLPRAAPNWCLNLPTNLSAPGHSGSFTLLPLANILLVEATRVLPDIAQVVKALGPATISQHRVAFITGPSRTADIEKRIVLGVHGPKDLYAAVVWQG